MNFPSFVKAMRSSTPAGQPAAFVASFDEEQQEMAAKHLGGHDLPVEVHAELKEIIHFAEACMSVSGSVD